MTYISLSIFFLLIRQTPTSTLFPYTTLFRSSPIVAIPTTASVCRRTAEGWSRRSPDRGRSEEHTSELQSLRHLVCRLLLEKKNAVIGIWKRSRNCLSASCVIFFAW